MIEMNASQLFYLMISAFISYEVNNFVNRKLQISNGGIFNINLKWQLDRNVLKKI